VLAADDGAARRTVEELCRRFLINPVIEDAEVSIESPRSLIEELPA
jgi:phosphoribosylformylglycinamidine (FGAM) synthase PurS component